VGGGWIKSTKTEPRFGCASVVKTRGIFKMSLTRSQVKRRRLTETGTFVTRSEIRKQRGGPSIITARNFGGTQSDLVDGGRATELANTPGYKSYIFYLAPNSSIGRKQVETGNKTVLVNTGLLFITVETKGDGKGNKYTAEILQYRSGQVLNLKKGQRYTYSTGNGEIELLVIESGDLSEKVLEEPLSNLTGAQQYATTRNPGVDISDLKTRKRKTLEEREAYGAAYAASRGHVTPREKAQISRAIAQGTHVDASQAVIGINPTPMGDIGDDYLPKE
jgi:hypothetical protein